MGIISEPDSEALNVKLGAGYRIFVEETPVTVMETLPEAVVPPDTEALTV